MSNSIDATLPDAVAVDFAVTGTANTKPVPGGTSGQTWVEITVKGCDVRISCGDSTVVAQKAADAAQTVAWQNVFFPTGVVKLHRRFGTYFSVIADDGTSTGFVQIVPVEG